MGNGLINGLGYTKAYFSYHSDNGIHNLISIKRILRYVVKLR